MLQHYAPTFAVSLEKLKNMYCIDVHVLQSHKRLFHTQHGSFLCPIHHLNLNVVFDRKPSDICPKLKQADVLQHLYSTDKQLTPLILKSLVLKFRILKYHLY